MRNKFFFLVVSIYGFFFHPSPTLADTGAQEWNQVVTVSAADSSTSGRGLLYQLRLGNKTAYLFGTIHAGHAAFYPLDAQTTKALSDSHQLIVEFDPRDTKAVAAAMTRYGFYSGAKRLDTQLPPASIEKLQRTLVRFGLPFEQIAYMKPWMAANLLIALDVEKDGISMRSGVEYHLLELAERNGKKVLELESAAYQLSLFDGMTESHQQKYLLEAVEAIESGEADRRIKRLLNGWGEGKHAVFEEAFQELLNEKTESAEFTRNVLLRQRNQEMASKIDALFRKGGSSFIAIGLLHLLGEDGVPEALRKKGYRLLRMH
jgi:uncharacterized protein YbaP (TraB family)